MKQILINGITKAIAEENRSLYQPCFAALVNKTLGQDPSEPAPGGAAVAVAADAAAAAATSAACGSRGGRGSRG